VAYGWLAKELSIPIAGPGTAEGKLQIRAEWIVRGASGISRDGKWYQQLYYAGLHDRISPEDYLPRTISTVGPRRPARRSVSCTPLWRYNYSDVSLSTREIMKSLGHDHYGGWSDMAVLNYQLIWFCLDRPA
jgi:hypothetical protein